MQLSTVTVIPRFEVPDRLRKAREVTGLDQAAFAEEIGVSRGTVRNYETGRSRPRKVVLIAWSLRTGVPIEWLEHGIEPAPDGPGDALGKAVPGAPNGGIQSRASTTEIRALVRPLRRRRPVEPYRLVAS